MKTIAFVLLAACSPTAMSTPAEHPANPDAPIGRLAGPPAALRPGVADASPPLAQPPVDHSQHTAPSPEPSTESATSVDAKPTDDKPTKPAAKQPTKAPKKDAPKKDAPVKKDAPKPTEPKPVETPKQPTPPPPTGHEGHH